jgi:hypothetical protein
VCGRDAIRVRSEQCSSGAVVARGHKERSAADLARVRWSDRLVWKPAVSSVPARQLITTSSWCGSAVSLSIHANEVCAIPSAASSLANGLLPKVGGVTRGSRRTATPRVSVATVAN